MSKDSKPRNTVMRLSEVSDPGEIKGRYKCPIYCKNCEKHDAVYILKGVSRALAPSVECSNCGCFVRL
jgi:hypothetical protein